VDDDDSVAEGNVSEVEIAPDAAVPSEDASDEGNAEATEDE